MITSRDFWDDIVEDTMCSDDEATPSASSRSGYASAPLSQKPLTSIGSRSTPFSSALNGQAVGTSCGRTSDPPVEATLQQKILQQRQRLQEKKRRDGTMAPSHLVMANENLPRSEAAFPAPPERPCAVLDQMNYSVDRQPLLEPRSVPLRTPGMSAMGPMMLDLRNLSMSSMALSDKDASAMIMPEIIYADSEEEEARRRNCRAQKLDERGICPVFDPNPGTGTYGAANFDISNISPAGMKAFILNPSPKEAGMIECRIVRERNPYNKFFPNYTMETDSGIFLMSARKRKHNKTSNYAITMSQSEFDKDCDGFLGKLRSNFFGLEFVSCGAGLNPTKIDRSMPQSHAIQLARQELVAVQYSSSLWGVKPRGPRKMCTVIPRVLPNGERLVCRTLQPDKEGLNALQKSGAANDLIDCYHNKPPKWNDQIGAFVLNFNKRVTQASVKNFQLTNSDDPDTVYLQFGRVGKDVFNMDFRHPFSPFQAFAICLSSFDYKLCCE